MYIIRNLPSGIRKKSHLQFQQTEVHNLRWNKEMSIRFQHYGLKELLCIWIATLEDWKKRLEFTYWKWSLAVLNANLCKKLTCIYVIYIHLYIACQFLNRSHPWESCVVTLVILVRKALPLLCSLVDRGSHLEEYYTALGRLWFRVRYSWTVVCR